MSTEFELAYAALAGIQQYLKSAKGRRKFDPANVVVQIDNVVRIDTPNEKTWTWSIQVVRNSSKSSGKIGVIKLLERSQTTRA